MAQRHERLLCTCKVLLTEVLSCHRKLRREKKYLRCYMALVLEVGPSCLWTFEKIRESGIMSPLFCNTTDLFENEVKFLHHITQ